MSDDTKPTHKTTAELYELQGGRCFYCGRQMRAHPWGNRHLRQRTGYTRDHVIPQDSGGGNHFNIVLACRTCNGTKGNRLPTESELARCRALYCCKPAQARDAEKDPWPEWVIVTKC